MSTSLPIDDLVAAIGSLSLADIDQRMSALDSERAALSRLRRSIVARDRARRRADSSRLASRTEGRRDA
jgi:hypothetical protein